MADDRVRARAEAGAEEDILDIASPHCLIIDVIGRSTVARQGALDRDFGVLTPLPGSLALGVVEYQFNRRATGRFACRRAVENDVLHRLAAQFGGLGLAEHPTHRIDDIGLAATVRADHTNQLAWNLEIRGINERLKSRQFNGG